MYKDNYQEYAAKGWKPFPVGHTDKGIIPEGVTGNSGTVTQAKMEEWAQDPHWANENIGLRMEGTLGFDLDHYKDKKGDEQYWHIVDMLDGEELPKTYSMTARGQGQPSRTYFFRVPSSAKFRSRAAKDIEILQYHHRYAVAAPSIHPGIQPLGSAAYQWYDPEGNPCAIPLVEDLADLKDAPGWYIYLLQSETRNSYTLDGASDLSKIDYDAWATTLTSGTPTEETRHLLHIAAPDWEDGRRDPTRDAVWEIARISILSPETPGLSVLWEEICKARLTSPTASTPEDNRRSDLRRSAKGAIAKWTAYKEEHPPLTDKQKEYIQKQAQKAEERKEHIRMLATDAYTEMQDEVSEAIKRDIIDANNNAPSTMPPIMPPMEDITGLVDLRDTPLSRWLKEKIDDYICWCSAFGWLMYKDGYWHKVPQETITKIVSDQLENLRLREEDANPAAKGLGSRTDLLKASKVASVRELVKTRLIREATEFDNYPDEINTPDGILDLRTLTTKPHSSKYLWTKQTRGSFKKEYANLETTHPDFKAATHALPTESLNYLQWKFGQAMTGYLPTDDRMCFLNGSGDNGKSALVTPCQKALGDFATLVPDKVLLSEKYGNSETAMVSLLGIRLAIMEELPESHYLDTKKLKEVVGTETMSGRFLYKDSITWTPTHSLFVTTNYIPQISETDHAVWKRMVLVKFPYRFKKHAAEVVEPQDRLGDPTLRLRLAQGDTGQWDAALTWMAVGAYAWYQNNKILPEPQGQVLHDTEDWRSESDQIQAYIDEFLEETPEGYVSTADLTKHFNEVSRGLGSAYSINSKTFKSRFQENAWVKQHKVFSVRIYTKGKFITRPDGWDMQFKPLSEKIQAWKGLKFKTLPNTFENNTVNPDPVF